MSKKETKNPETNPISQNETEHFFLLKNVVNGEVSMLNDKIDNKSLNGKIKITKACWGNFELKVKDINNKDYTCESIGKIVPCLISLLVEKYKYNAKCFSPWLCNNNPDWKIKIENKTCSFNVSANNNTAIKQLYSFPVRLKQGPQSSSIAREPMEEWEKVIRDLVQNNLKVCFNYVGNDEVACQKIMNQLTNGEIDIDDGYNEREMHQLVKENVNSYADGWSPPFSRNRIIFGAPGTGKSFLASGNANYLLFSKKQNNLAKDEVKYVISSIDIEESGNLSRARSWCMERVTFHPEYSYYDFVGSYKPVMREVPVADVKDGNQGKGEDEQGEQATERKIEYEFVPGPFARILVKALNDKEHPYLLLIEEINRARVAAVFGDIFQLLDRDTDGESEYPICISEDLKDYLKGQGLERDELKLPSNLYIWATMNSADQGVYPLDTAFKRRWSMEYLDINTGEKDDDWNTIRDKINKLLLKKGNVNEDKLMGYYFLKPEERTNAHLEDSLKGKVLMYLFDDAAKPCRKSVFKEINEKRTYSELRKALSLEMENLNIFEGDPFSVYAQDDKWDKIRKGINKLLETKCKVGEEKHLGYFFLEKNERDTDEHLKAALFDKVLKYLFETVDDDHRRELFQLGDGGVIDLENLNTAMQNAMADKIDPNSKLGVFSEALQ